eukprot:TRINITY_DN2258_c0_g1_i2.p1 TRINITY_DN2258_c0_g1~~TRINITY_DN2258_c0_g1_i2.p1  ORF type:complete len:170 (-),score=36.06 TRINITY_DN2258_c0_g1_i2:197-706(-)
MVWFFRVAVILWNNQFFRRILSQGVQFLLQHPRTQQIGNQIVSRFAQELTKVVERSTNKPPKDSLNSRFENMKQFFSQLENKAQPPSSTSPASSSTSSTTQTSNTSQTPNTSSGSVPPTPNIYSRPDFANLPPHQQRLLMQLQKNDVKKQKQEMKNSFFSVLKRGLFKK